MANFRVKSISNDGSTIGLEMQAPSGSKIQALQYPLNMVGDQDIHNNFLCMYCVDGMSGGASNLELDQRSLNSVRGKFNEKTLAVIQMYMPALHQNISHEYSDNDGGFIQDMMMNYAGSVDGELSSVASGLTTAAAKTAVTLAAVNLGKVSQRYNAQIGGQILGNRNANMYRGTGLRTQLLTFNLRPKSLAELKEVGQIIRAFQIYSSASVTGRASVNDIIRTVSSDKDLLMKNGDSPSFSVLKVPPIWYLEERVNSQSDKIRYTPKFALGPCALTNIRISSTPDQIYNSFEETAGDPIAIDLELTFTELRPVNKEYWESLTNNLGTSADSGQFFFGSYGDK